MTSKLVLNVVQLGNDEDPSKNLVIRTNKDGTFTIARGNAGATTQDILSVDAQGNLIPKQPGSVIQVVLRNDPGSVKASVPWTNTSADFAKITPRSSNSKIRVRVSFYGHSGSLSGTVTYANYRIYEDNITPLANPISAGNFTIAGQAGGPWSLEAIVDNTALVERKFSLWVSNNVAGSGGAGATYQTWELMEVAA